MANVRHRTAIAAPLWLAFQKAIYMAQKPEKTNRNLTPLTAKQWTKNSLCARFDPQLWWGQTDSVWSENMPVFRRTATFCCCQSGRVCQCVDAVASWAPLERFPLLSTRFSLHLSSYPSWIFKWVQPILGHFRDGTSPGMPFSMWKLLPELFLQRVADLLGWVEAAGERPDELLPACVAMILKASGGTARSISRKVFSSLEEVARQICRLFVANVSAKKKTEKNRFFH